MNIAYAGGVNSISNTSYYLYTGSIHFTISPSTYNKLNSTTNSAYLFSIHLNGDISGDGVYTYSYAGNYVRPVISLHSDIELSGLGTSADP